MVLGLTEGCLFRLGHQVLLFGLFDTLVLLQDIQMRTTDMTPKKLFSVPCPTCGVAAGQRCVLHSGRLRNQPHVDRKLCATETVVKKSR